MKTKLQFKAIVTLLLIPSFIFSLTNEGVKHEKRKVIKKEYTVNANATLNIDNSYGNIDIVTWNENRVEIEVTITTKSSNEEKAQKKLDDITVEFSATNDYVSAKTKFNKSKSSSWWNWGKNNNVNMEINYVVKLPVTNSVDLDNNYGSINLDKLEGHAKIDCDYGQITTKELMADDNIINFDYTNNSHFEYIKSGKINADYSSYTVAKTKKLDISADYTNSNVEVAEDINYSCDYGNIKIDNANNVTGNGDYLTTVLGDVYKNVQLKAGYGSIKIKNMTANAGNVIIQSDYAGISIGFDPNYNFKFNLDLQYASLRNKSDLEIMKQIEKNNTKSYAGYYGVNSTSNTITINSDYGSVSLSKN